MRHLGMFFGATAMLAAMAPAQPRLPTATEIENLARQALRDTDAKGLAIAMIDNGKVLSAKAFGVRNAKSDPLTTSTVMYGASLTKTVFAYYALMLADEGRLDLDRPLASMLPRPLPDYGNLEAYGAWGDLAGDQRWRRLTARHLLTHSSGFANFSFFEPDGNCASISIRAPASLTRVKA
jgi:CubicO group peptidase (beta-lactamase class C family)